jgi:hypothetical protein
MKVCAQFHSLAALPQGKSPRYPLVKRLSGHHRRSGRGGEEKNIPSLPLTACNLVTALTASKTTYRPVFLLRKWIIPIGDYPDYPVTPWSIVPLEKLNVTQLVKKFPAFYGIRMFITVFTKATTTITTIICTVAVK